MHIYILSEKSFQGAENLPVIIIKFLEKSIDLSNYDALIFTSKNGVEAINRINKDWKKIDAYSIGSGTSKAIERFGGRVVYMAKSSYGDNFAVEISEKLKGKKVLFLRARVVTSSMNKILRKAGIDLDEDVVYETVCNECSHLKQPSDNSVIIFSSPSTIECFFNCFVWKESYQAVVIGDKTASFMPKEVNYCLSEQQTIPSCIEFAKKLRKI